MAWVINGFTLGESRIADDSKPLRPNDRRAKGTGAGSDAPSPRAVAEKDLGFVVSIRREGLGAGAGTGEGEGVGEGTRRTKVFDARDGGHDGLVGPKGSTDRAVLRVSFGHTCRRTRCRTDTGL